MADITRQRKVADRITQTVARCLERRIKDPRLGFVTITDTKVTGDLQNATVFYTVYGDDKQKKLTAQALNSAKGIIRSQVGKALGIRLTPTIRFELDDLQASAANIEDILVRARLQDEQIAQYAADKSYAGEANPYKEDPQDDEASHISDDTDESSDVVENENSNTDNIVYHRDDISAGE